MDGSEYRSTWRALGNNARKSYVELAHELEVSDATIHNRIRGMTNAGIIKGFVTLIDFERIGFTVLAFVELKTKPEKRRHCHAQTWQDSRE